MIQFRLWPGQAFRLIPCCRTFSRSQNRTFNSIGSVQNLLKRKGGIRFSSGYLQPPKQSYVFPERLLVYHAGMIPTVWIGFSKVTAFLLFGFACTILAPQYIALNDRTMVLLVVVGGAIPSLVVLWATRPYVASLSIRLPAQARASRDALLHWSKSMRTSTPIDITTVGILGLPKTSTFRLGSLTTCKEKGTIANMQRIVDPAEKARIQASWRINMVPSKYFVMENRRTLLQPTVWRAFKDQIEDNARKLAAQT